MRNLIFTLYKHKQDINSNPVEKTWLEWKHLLSNHVVRGESFHSSKAHILDVNKNGPAIILGYIPANMPRKDTSVQYIDALALDIDDFPEDSVLDILSRLKEYEYLVYTTHKHGAKCVEYPRLRVIFPLSEPVYPQDFSTVWNQFNALTGGITDQQTKNISRLLFLPSTFDLSVAWSYSNTGSWLNPYDLPDCQVDQLIKLKRQLAYTKKYPDLKEPIKKLLAGQSFAEEGDRHNIILKLTMLLAQKNPSLNDSALTKLFDPSLAVMQTQNDPPTIKEVLSSYEGAVAKLKQQDEDKKEKALKIQSAGQEPYTDEQIEQIAKSNNLTAKQLKTKWIIQRDGCAWFLTDKGYEGPFSSSDLSIASTKLLSRAPVRLVEITKNGYRRRSFNEIVCDYGDVASKVVVDLAIDKTYFDTTTRTVYEAATPLRKLEPKFDEQIDTWLKRLGGKQYKKLVDWLACVSDLNKLLCAVYFDGVGDSGKTLFAYGLAKLWTEGPPAEVDATLGTFNDEITRCPLALADEEIPKKHQQNVTAVLRSMLSTPSRTLKRKFLPTAEVRGAIRLVLAANNEFLLESKDVATAADLKSIAQRFFYVHADQVAADYLNSLSRETTKQWAKSGIAQHALWLAKNHVVENPGRRFWVEGSIDQMHRMLMTGSFWNSRACEWLVRYMLQPELFDSRDSGLVRRLDGQLLVNDQAIVDGWQLYFPNTKIECNTSKIGAALRAISDDKRKQIRFKGKPIRYRVIDMAHLYDWSDRHNIGDMDTIRDNLVDKKQKPTMFDFEKKKAKTEDLLDKLKKEKKQDEKIIVSLESEDDIFMSQRLVQNKENK